MDNNFFAIIENPISLFADNPKLRDSLVKCASGDIAHFDAVAASKVLEHAIYALESRVDWLQQSLDTKRATFTALVPEVVKVAWGTYCVNQTTVTFTPNPLIGVEPSAPRTLDILDKMTTDPAVLGTFVKRMHRTPGGYALSLNDAEYLFALIAVAIANLGLQKVFRSSKMTWGVSDLIRESISHGVPKTWWEDIGTGVVRTLLGLPISTQFRLEDLSGTVNFSMNGYNLVEAVENPDGWDLRVARCSGKETTDYIIYDVFEPNSTNEGIRVFALQDGETDMFTLSPDDYLDEDGVYRKADEKDPDPVFESDNILLDEFAQLLGEDRDYENWRAVCIKPNGKPLMVFLKKIDCD